MSEMVERVALAISGGDDPASILSIHRTRARLAIEAMREPTDQQRNAYYELSHRTETMFDANWERAIDAALKD